MMNSDCRPGRTLLFGGALCVAGLSAHAQELQLDTSFAPEPYVYIQAYECSYSYNGDCYSYDYTASFTLWYPSDPDLWSLVDDAAIAGRVYRIDATPTRFELSFTPSPPDRPDDALWIAFTRMQFAQTVTAPAVVEYAFDFAQWQNVDVLVNGQPITANDTGRVVLRPGEVISASGFASAGTPSFRIEILGPGPCDPADLAEPFGQRTFADITAFLTAFTAGDPVADFAAPFGELTFADVLSFLTAFTDGCP